MHQVLVEFEKQERAYRGRPVDRIAYVFVIALTDAESDGGVIAAGRTELLQRIVCSAIEWFQNKAWSPGLSHAGHRVGGTHASDVRGDRAPNAARKKAGRQDHDQ